MLPVRTIFSALTLTGCLIALVLYVRQQDRTHAEEMKAEITSLKELVDDVKDRRQGQQRSQTLVTTHWRQHAAVEDFETDPDEPEQGLSDESGDPAEFDEAPAPEDQSAYMETFFDQQAPDPAWARDSETQLSEAINEHLGESRLQTLECRADLCRAEIEHRDSKNYFMFLDQIAGHSHSVWKGEIALLRVGQSESGSVAQHLYFAKPGSVLPVLE